MDMQINNLIDWEQRRYEISKSMLETILTNNELIQRMGKNQFVKTAIDFADELIKQLKESAI